MVEDYDKSLENIVEVYKNTLKDVENHESYKDSFDSECVDGCVEIEGFLFFADEISPDNSYSKREYKRTSIMGGGEFVSRGTYQPKEFSFNSCLEIDPSEPYVYDNLFYLMENKPGGCEIICKYLGHFWGEVSINKTHPEASPHVINVEVKIKEIPKPNANLYGDGVLEYPPIDRLSDKVITISNSNLDEFKNELKYRYDNPYHDYEDYTNRDSYDS